MKYEMDPGIEDRKCGKSELERERERERNPPSTFNNQTTNFSELQVVSIPKFYGTS